MTDRGRVLRTLLLTGTAGFLLVGSAWWARGQSDGAERKILEKTRPVYPELARQMHLSGTLLLAVTISPSGTVETVTLTSGHPLLFRAAEAAVRQWRYAPARETTAATVNVNFTMSH